MLFVADYATAPVLSLDGAITLAEALVASGKESDSVRVRSAGKVLAKLSRRRGGRRWTSSAPRGRPAR